MKTMEELELKSPKDILIKIFKEEGGIDYEGVISDNNLMLWSMHEYGKQCFEAARFHYEDEDGWDGVYYNSFRDYEDYKLNLK